VIITGGNSGVGAATATALAAQGHSVMIACRTLDKGQRVAAEMPGDVEVRALDLADLSSVRAFADSVESVDVLVNNAGVSDGPANAEAQDPDDFRRVLEVNLEACFVLARLCAPSMLAAGRGSIVNISSIHGLVASSPNRQAGYVASKFGLVGLTQELGCQWADQGVRVNAIAPGYFASELSSPMLDDESGLRWVVRNTPMRRAGDPHELDGALLFLAGDASTYITGQTLAVDGGWTAR